MTFYALNIAFGEYDQQHYSQLYFKNSRQHIFEEMEQSHFLQLAVEKNLQWNPDKKKYAANFNLLSYKSIN